MNERIRELAEKASHQSPDGYPVTIPYSKDFAEKFAELIVRECIEMSNLESAHYQAQAVKAESKQAFDYEFNSAATCLGVGLRIKKHFGVK